jgi:glycerol-3-phosphate acyltransferase PlsX
MGGDHGAAPIVLGALQSLEHHVNGDLRVVLVGHEEEISKALRTHEKIAAGRVDIQHAPEFVSMHDPATDGVRRKDTSIAVGMRLHQEGRADGFVSTGNTGAVMASALFTLKSLPGVIRPAIASLFPNPLSATVVLDVGANTECKPQHLWQFAVMGSIFSQFVLKHPRPKVGLLSIGEEKSKGNELTQAAHKMLSEEKSIHFVGNVEGRDVLSGEYEVVVTDGFVGNILLKFAESVGPLLENKLRHQINTNMFSRFGALLMTPFLRRLRNSLDYAEYGGAPLLGVNGVVVICHGSSGAKAIKNAILEAEKSVRQKVNMHIKEQLEKVQTPEPSHAS